MKFKKGDRVEYIGGKSGGFTKGKIYIVSEDDLDKDGYVCIKEDDKSSNTNGHYPKYFKLIEENKMKTDAKTMAGIYRHMADNLESGMHGCDGIECFINDIWHKKTDHCFYFDDYLYRIKPKTIIVNGVEIPEPLDVSEIEDDGHYYHVANYKMLAYEDHGASIKKDGVLFVYRTREEAIEASKKLFGIE